MFSYFILSIQWIGIVNEKRLYYEFKKFCKLLGKRISKLRKQQKISIKELSCLTGIITDYIKK